MQASTPDTQNTQEAAANISLARLNAAIDQLDTVLDGKAGASSVVVSPSLSKKRKLDARDDKHQSTPALMALLGLQRAQQPETVHPLHGDEQRTLANPYSREALQTRLATFKLSTYSDKPRAIDAMAAARHGWLSCNASGQRDRLECPTCGANWRVEFASHRRTSLSPSEIEGLENISRQLVTAHKDKCIWRARQSPASLLALPIHAPAVLAMQCATNASEMTEWTDSEIQLRLPPEITPTIIGNIRTTLKRAAARDQMRSSSRQPSAGLQVQAITNADSWTDSNTTLAVFGWRKESSSTDHHANAKARIIVCDYCQRRAALTPGKAFEPIASHRLFCEFLNTLDFHGQKVVGWKAVLDILSTGSSHVDSASQFVRSQKGHSSHATKASSRLELMQYVHTLLGPTYKKARAQ